ncbi:MAG: hypothetical protein U5N86_07905 [Planctomycetota bacterium]|nr:hypothetical protein [Planctomycetota bacterium]
MPGTGWSQAELVKRNPDYVYFETAESKGIYRASRMAQASVARDSDFSIDTKMSAVSSSSPQTVRDGCLVKAYGSEEGVSIEGAPSAA